MLDEEALLEDQALGKGVCWALYLVRKPYNNDSSQIFRLLYSNPKP